MVTGEVPKILTILPIGCRAYAVKPVGSYVKSNFESRACSGVNLGRCSSIPHAYNIWLPEQHKVIQTSEVYFDESLASQRRLGTPSPTSAPAADPSDISTGGVNPSSGTVPAPTAASSLTRGLRERHSRRHLAHLQLDAVAPAILGGVQPPRRARAVRAPARARGGHVR